ncbi:MAG: hydratase [Oscillospiraceae bacterium]|nr:hydratase [Oscillospiraceae bacterium]
MMKLSSDGVFLANGRPVPASEYHGSKDEGRDKTIAWSVLSAHHPSGSGEELRIRFDALISHDITYVGIIQTARASGLERFPLPYTLTNCHNSLCAVGGTINEDDHVFGLSAAKKYGGIFVPANLAVIHQYAREEMAACGRMILGSDSHTRYGPLGTMGVGEGGPELVKQLLENTYDIARPETVLVYLTGAPRRGVGPHDVAIALCGAVYKNGFVKNRVLEFVGPAIAGLSMDYRFGIDVMTTETACLSSIWQTDSLVEEYLTVHGRGESYRALAPAEGAYYDRCIELDLSEIEPMAALPFHPSEAYTIRQLLTDGGDILREAEKRAEAQFGGKVSLDLTGKLGKRGLYIGQGIIAGCAGGMYENIAEADAILRSGAIGAGEFALSVYPSSVPVNMELMASGVQQSLMAAGAVFKPCFCGPCFGAGDVPANNTLSARHATRNFPNREGSRPDDGQLAGVMLMDSRSIAATAANGGWLAAADEVDYVQPEPHRPTYNSKTYAARVYHGYGKPDESAELKFGPNIAPWPDIAPLGDNLLLRVCSVIRDSVTTTDELIPSGETSSYRSNPIKLASFALSRRDPGYVDRAKAVQSLTKERVTEVLGRLGAEAFAETTVGSVIFANRPGDGSAREQAASCQRVLGGCANICYEFATKRYRSNCINWGMLPLNLDADAAFDCEVGDWIYIPNVKSAVEQGSRRLQAVTLTKSGLGKMTLNLPELTAEEREIILRGCLMNYYAAQRKG